MERHACTLSLPQYVLEGACAGFQPFYKQYTAVCKKLEERASELSIALIAIYGSVVKGVRPGSDIDILVLLSPKYKIEGWDYLDLCDEIQETAESAKVNAIPLDVHIRSWESFRCLEYGEQFKRSLCSANKIIWEDGVTIDRRYIEAV